MSAPNLTPEERAMLTEAEVKCLNDFQYEKMNGLDFGYIVMGNTIRGQIKDLARTRLRLAAAERRLRGIVNMPSREHGKSNSPNDHYYTNGVNDALDDVRELALAYFTATEKGAADGRAANEAEE